MGAEPALTNIGVKLYAKIGKNVILRCLEGDGVIPVVGCDNSVGILLL